ncbi:MAG: TetR/AcrR family transcriptional regulator [Bacillota bacterium]|nr:TetR/AcrR family transcriptional regulator [Bacillota bacterium]
MLKTKKKQMKRRSEIIENTLHLLETTPFEELSVRDICSAENISTGTFYHYFSKKDDLLVGLLSLIDIHMEEQVFPQLVNEDELENLKIVAREFASYIMGHGIERSKLISNCDLTDLDIYKQKRSIGLKLSEIVARGQEKKQLTTIFPAEKIAELLLIAMRGVSVDWSRRNGCYSLTERMEEFITLFFTSLVHTEQDN